MSHDFDVERLYAATTPAELTAEYDRVAETYDAALVEGHEWRMPEIMAGLAAWLLPRTARVLDGACGTGLVGESLSRFGFRDVHGLDLSPGMVAVARRKGVYAARFTLASDMLHDLAAQDSSAQLARRLRRYIRPDVLCIDEVGYLSYDTRYADLLFQVVTRRYQQRSTILTTNKSFGEWNQVFPNASCVVALVDRLVHHAEILDIEGQSYRFKEAQERAALRAAKKPTATKKR